MNNLFQQQLLKAGVVSKQQVKKVQKEQHKKTKQQRLHKEKDIDPDKLIAEQEKTARALRDRELNQRKQQQAHKKALSAEIDQLISTHCIKRDAKCEIVYNFEHRSKVMRLYVNAELKQQIIKGSLGIARIEGRFELVPVAFAEKIAQLNALRVILFIDTAAVIEADDPYADYQVPDDLTW